MAGLCASGEGSRRRAVPAVSETSWGGRSRTPGTSSPPRGAWPSSRSRREGRKAGLRAGLAPGGGWDASAPHWPLRLSCCLPLRRELCPQSVAAPPQGTCVLLAGSPSPGLGHSPSGSHGPPFRPRPCPHHPVPPCIPRGLSWAHSFLDTVLRQVLRNRSFTVLGRSSQPWSSGRRSRSDVGFGPGVPSCTAVPLCPAYQTFTVSLEKKNG